MTVKELIDKLKEFDPELPVAVRSISWEGDAEFEPAETVIKEEGHDFEIMRKPHVRIYS